MLAIRCCLCALVLYPGLRAQSGTQPKAAATEYPVHGKTGDIALGAEYLVHSFSSQGRTFFADDYLVMEVAVYPPKGGQVELSTGYFMLRINGKKQVLSPDAPGLVAGSLKYSDWEYPRDVQATVGAGPADVILGRRRAEPRFPGDRRDAERTTGPPATKAPAQVPGGVEKERQQTPAEAAVESALPQSAYPGPVSGHLYFRYKGKTKSIKKLELIYRHGDQETVLPLF